MIRRDLTTIAFSILVSAHAAVAQPSLPSAFKGQINPAAPASRATEVGADGKIVYAQQTDGAPTYRSFRVLRRHERGSRAHPHRL